MCVQLHREVSNATIDHPKVSGQNALALANIITFDCELESIKCPEAKELVHLLSSPHIEVRFHAYIDFRNYASHCNYCFYGLLYRLH